MKTEQNKVFEDICYNGTLNSASLSDKNVEDLALLRFAVHSQC